MTTPTIIDRKVSASAVVAAPPAEVFALLANPHRHHEFDGSGTVRAAVSGPEKLGLGDRFGMDMKMKVGYRVTNEVVEFEQDRLIAWCHPARARWRYELEPTGTETHVAEPARPPSDTARFGDAGSERQRGTHVAEPARPPSDTARFGDAGSERQRGTRITETFDYARSPVRWGIALMRMPQRNATSIRRTLGRLQEIFGAA